MTRHKNEHGRYRPSHATVIAYLALFVALGGTAGALQGTNSVFSDDIVAQEVKSSDIRPGAVGTGKIADGSLLDQDLAAGQNTARAYAYVPAGCNTAAGYPHYCPTQRVKGIGLGLNHLVFRTSAGRYCITALGLDADELPAVATVEEAGTIDPFRASVRVSAVSPAYCPQDDIDFGVITESVHISGGALVSTPSNSISFTIVIP